MGLVQGLTEFLPVSSSGHLFIAPSLMGFKEPGAAFTAVIQLGTLAAVLIYFAKDLAALIKGFFAGLFDKSKRSELEFKQALGVAIGTLPIIVIGLLFKDQIEGVLRNAYLIAAMLIIFGLFMGYAEKVGKQTKKWEDLTAMDGLKLGLWQCLALIPGSSRSGTTITGGLIGGMDRAVAARYSFLLSVPAVFGSGLYGLYKERDAISTSMGSATLVATVVAFISGYAAIAFLMKMLQSKSTWPFVWYRVALGCTLIALTASGVVPVGG